MPYHLFQTTLGYCVITWTTKGLQSVQLLGDNLAQAKKAAAAAAGGEKESAPSPAVAKCKARLVKHLAGESQDFSDIALDWDLVTAFQQEVYKAAQRIQPGNTRSYGELAADLGRDSGNARAIGGALGKNPWLIVVPCHRILGANGKLTGFSAAGGIRTKARLLELEHAPENSFVGI